MRNYSLKLNRRQRAHLKNYEEILKPFLHTKKENIAYLIYYSIGKFIIYIDTENELHWEMTDEFGADKDEIVTDATVAINLLKHKSTVTQFDSKSTFLFNCILGNILIAAFGENQQEYENALKEAEEYLNKKERETTRIWYVQYSLSILIFLTSVYLVLYFVAGENGPGADIADIYQYLYWGAMGCAFSMLQSADKITYTCNAGRKLVFMEILSKFVISMLSVMMITAAFDLKIIFSGFITEANETVFKMLLCMFAGLSERIVPSLVEKLEGVEGISTEEVQNEEQ